MKNTVAVLLLESLCNVGCFVLAVIIVYFARPSDLIQVMLVCFFSGQIALSLRRLFEYTFKKRL